MAIYLRIFQTSRHVVTELARIGVDSGTLVADLVPGGVTATDSASVAIELPHIAVAATGNIGAADGAVEIEIGAISQALLTEIRQLPNHIQEDQRQAYDKRFEVLVI